MSKRKKMRPDRLNRAPYTSERRLQPLLPTPSQLGLKRYWEKKIVEAETELGVRLLQEHCLLLTGWTELDPDAAHGWIGNFKASAARRSMHQELDRRVTNWETVTFEEVKDLLPTEIHFQKMRAYMLEVHGPVPPGKGSEPSR